MHRWLLCDENGNEIIGSNTFEENFPGELDQEIDKYSIQFNLPLRPVSYSVTVAGSENYSSVTF